MKIAYEPEISRMAQYDALNILQAMHWQQLPLDVHMSCFNENYRVRLPLDKVPIGYRGREGQRKGWLTP